jgi:hypothetical protein
VQQEWQFVQRVVEGIGKDVSEVEKAITNLFLPSLFADQFDENNPRCKTVTAELKVCKIVLNGFALELILEDLDCNTSRTTFCGKETGQWLSVMPSTLNGTKLSPQEFWDSLHLRYVRTPGDQLLQASKVCSAFFRCAFQAWCTTETKC